MPSVRRLPRVAAASLLLVFLLANARGLDSTPVIHQDEAWIAAPGVELFTSGNFATRLFAGYYGSERHYYDFMPLYSILDGAVIRVFGRSLVTVRSLSLSLAALTLLLTFLVGKRLLSEWHGVVAMLILIAWPIGSVGAGAGAGVTGVSGIPLTDLGRLGRYDILVSVFGLACLLTLVRGLEGNRMVPGWLALSGALAALATLTHYYGIVWLVVIATMVIVVTGRRGARQLGWAGAGFLVTMLPWLWFISRNFAMFATQKLAQLRDYTGGLGSLTTELSRFDPVVSAALSGNISSVLWIVLVMSGIVLLARSTLRHPTGARLLSITIAVILICFVLLVRRNYRYLATVWPLLALAASFAILHPWPRRYQSAARAVLVLLVASASSTGVLAYRQLADHARQVTPYSDVCTRIVQRLPASARLLALQHWWLGVGPHVSDYRSFLVAATRMNPRTGEAPMSFEAAVAIDPMDFILIDPAMADLLRSSGDATRPIASAMAGQIAAFLQERGELVDEFDASGYGSFKLYRVAMVSQR